MSETCCDKPAAPEPKRCCPLSRGPGQKISWQTLAAQARGTLPPRQDVFLCLDPECEVVYFGSAGALIRDSEVWRVPGFKARGDGLVCYCFLHREQEIREEVAQRGHSSVLEELTQRVHNGDCACEVRNPRGRCCLGEVNRITRDQQARAHEPARWVTSHEEGLP